MQNIPYFRPVTNAAQKLHRAYNGVVGFRLSRKSVECAPWFQSLVEFQHLKGRPCCSGSCRKGPRLAMRVLAVLPSSVCTLLFSPTASLSSSGSTARLARQFVSSCCGLQQRFPACRVDVVSLNVPLTDV